jgi:hypothetical protein
LLEESDLLKRFFANAFPNPNREGCPDQTVLRAIAAATLPLDHPALAHVSSCSPCYTEVESLTKEFQAARRRKVHLLAAAAVVAVAGGVVLWTIHNHRRTTEQPLISEARKSPPPQVPSSPQSTDKTPVNIPIDLRPFAPTRNIVDQKPMPSFPLPSDHVNLQITLPLGSDDGSYEVRIQAPGSAEAVKATNGRATIIDGDTRLEVDLDLSGVAPGQYTMLYRHVDASWHRVPLSITK